jgi:hypothetical protein
VGYYSKKIELFEGVPNLGVGYDFWNGTRCIGEEASADGLYSVDQYQDRFKEIIKDYVGSHLTKEAQEDNPLFVYYSHQTVHTPIESNANESRCNHIRSSSPLRFIYCSMMVELDDKLGETLRLLKTNGLWDNSLVVLTTDNGGLVNYALDSEGEPVFPSSAGSNWPLRGGKTTLFEGGVRSTALITGGLVPEEHRSTTFGGLLHAVDFHKTLLSAAGYNSAKSQLANQIDGSAVMTAGAEDDGIDILAAIAANDSNVRNNLPLNVVLGAQAYSAIIFRWPMADAGAEGGDLESPTSFKLIVGDGLQIPGFSTLCSGEGITCYGEDSWFRLPSNITDDGPVDIAPPHDLPYYLFDLEADPEERHDLSESRQDLVDYGVGILERYANGEAGEYRDPQPNLPAPEALPAFNNGIWAPFIDVDNEKS